MKSSTKYLICVVALVLAVAAIAAVGIYRSRNSADNKPKVEATSAPEKLHDTTLTVQPDGTAVEEVPIQKVTPTFMYFVSQNDELYADAEAVYRELEAEYADRVKFEFKDVDAEPDLKDRFSINTEGAFLKTPTLIMLDVNNDISTIGLSECVDKTTLKEAIEKALKA